MGEIGPFTLFVVFLKALLVFVALAAACVWLLRKKYGGYDGYDWLVLISAGVVAFVVLLISDNVQARYLEQVGSNADGMLTRKWIVEGDDSVSFKVAVQFRGYEGIFDVSEGYYDLVTPPTGVKVVYDPEYASDFVPVIAIHESPKLWVLVGLLGSAALALSATVGWVLLRAKQRFFPARS